MAESKSTSVSLDVYSLQFKGCKDIFPIKIVRPLKKQHLDHQLLLASVLDEVITNQLKIGAMVADNPKRAFLRNSLQFCARHGCEYCFQPGVSFRKINSEQSNILLQKLSQQKQDLENQISLLNIETDTVQIQSLKNIVENLDEAEKLARKKKASSHIVWPSNTRHGEPRTREKIMEIVEKIESGIELSAAEKKGIKGRSLLLDIEGFDYVVAIQTEYMHLFSLGFVKRLLEQCFCIGESRSRIIKTKLASPVQFNDLMKKIKVVREFSRRARSLDLAVMKAQEMRNILLFFF